MRPQPLAALRGAAAGAALHVEGVRLLARQPRLWPLAAVPFALGVLALGGAGVVLVREADVLWGFVAGWLPAAPVAAWYQWLWVGPLRALGMALGAVLFLAVCAAVLVAAWLLAGVVSAPFLDALSRRVERLVTGRLEERASGAGPVRDALRSVLEELRRLAFFVSVQLVLGALALVLPGGALLGPPAMLAVAALFLPLDHAGPVLDRRQVRFAARRRWVLRHRAVMLGFGGAAVALGLVPGLNFLALPAFVVSGTLLALRLPPDEPAAPGVTGAGDAPAGSPTST